MALEVKNIAKSYVKLKLLLTINGNEKCKTNM